MTRTAQHKLEELAEILLSHYRDGNAPRSGRVRRRNKYRVIVVVGAGASASTGLKTGLATVAAIREEVDKNVSALLVDAELERLQFAFGLSRDDLETQLLACSRFDQRTVVGKLQELFDVAHYPTLSYEVLAHLLKHRFVDAVVNFNFDELLDQAVEEELGAKRYAKIVFEGDCARELQRMRPGEWFPPGPLYVKPHGTATEPSSLRFTREAYFTMPREIHSVLRKLLGVPPERTEEGSGQRAKPESQQRLCVIVVGHAMQSFEFNALLARAHPDSRIYVFDPVHTNTASWPDEMKNMLSDRWTRLGKVHSLDARMRGLYRCIEKECATRRLEGSALIPPRGIERHEYIALLFRATRPNTLERRAGSAKLRDYLRDRVLVELALAIAKARGFVDARELIAGRVGRFINLLEKEGARPRLVAFLPLLGLRRVGPSRDAYWHKSAADSVVSGGALTLTTRCFREQTMRMLEEDLLKQLTTRRRKKLRELPTRRAFRRALRTMFDGEEVEVMPAPAQLSAQFLDAEPLPTLSAFKTRTAELLRESWDLVLVVAESGEWMRSTSLLDPTRKGRPRVGVIVADRKLAPLFTSLGISCLALPWYLHNRHMTIFLKRTKRGGFRPERALYYERRYRAASIAPMEVGNNVADVRAVLDDFVVYWIKAERYRDDKGDAVVMSGKKSTTERKRILRIISENTAQ